MRKCRRKRSPSLRLSCSVVALCTNAVSLVRESQRDCCSKSWVCLAIAFQPQRGCSLQPSGCRVGEATLGKGPQMVPTLNGLHRLPSSNEHGRCNPVGVEERFHDLSQGSSCIATLGRRTQSLWDWPKGREPVELSCGGHGDRGSSGAPPSQAALAVSGADGRTTTRVLAGALGWVPFESPSLN